MDDQQDQPAPADLDELLVRMRARVEERRRTGAYPPGLEEEMEGHFRRIAAHRFPAPEVVATPIRERMSQAVRLPAVDPGRLPVDPGRLAVPTSSALPGGSVVHGAVNRLVSRQSVAILAQVHEESTAILAQVQDLANGVWDSLLVLADLLADLVVSTSSDPANHAHAELVGLVDAVVERITAYEREPAQAPVAVAELARRLDRLEEAEAARTARPWFRVAPVAGDGSVERPALTADAREQANASGATAPGAVPDPGAMHARGARATASGLGLGPAGVEIGDDVIDQVVASLRGREPVLELGSGPGRLLVALAEAGIEARGVESDLELVGLARRAGVEVADGDPMTFMGATSDQALGGLVAIGLVESLGPQRLLDLVRWAADRVLPGGRMVLGATNPRSLWGLAHGAGARPDRALVDPGWLARCCEEAGFASVEVEWCSPPPGSAGGETLVGEEARYHRLLFAPTTYLVVAER